MGEDLALYRKVDVSNQIVEIQKSEVERQREIIKGLGKIVEQLMYEKQKFLNLEQENSKYQELYGEFDTPFLIWKEMCKSNQIRVGGIAVPPKDFKHPTIEQTKRNKHKVIYWVSLFEQWGLVNNYESRHYILDIPWRKGKYIIKRKLENQNHGIKSRKQQKLN